MTQATLFELSPEEAERKRRMRSMLNDRKLARHLMYGNDHEAIEFLLNSGVETLAEAIQIAIDNPCEDGEPHLRGHGRG